MSRVLASSEMGKRTVKGTISGKADFVCHLQHLNVYVLPIRCIPKHMDATVSHKTV